MDPSAHATRQRRNRVNGLIFPILFSLAACSSDNVPQMDTIRAAYQQQDYVRARELAATALKANPSDSALVFLSGQIALDSGNLDFAKAQMQRLLPDAQFGARARVELARTFLLLGNPREALATLGAKPSSGLGYSLAATAASLLGYPEKEGRLMMEGLEAFPTSNELLVHGGNNALSIGDVAAARTWTERALQIGAQDKDVQMLAARLALAENKPAKAEQYLDAILRKWPNDGLALLSKAEILGNAGNLKAAEALFVKASGPGNRATSAVSATARYYRAQLAFDTGKYDTARDLLAGIGQPKAFLPTARLAGVLAAYKENDEQAIDLLRHFLGQGGEDPLARYALAISLARVGQKSQAWSYLRPIALLPDANAPTRELAARLTRELNLPEASRFANVAAEGMSSQPTPLALEGANALSKGDLRKADALLTKALQSAPQTQDHILLNNAALVRQKLGDLPGAEKLARRALATAPNDPIIMDTLGWILFAKNGPTPEVRGLIGRAQRALPNDPDVQQHARAVAQAAGR